MNRKIVFILGTFLGVAILSACTSGGGGDGDDVNSNSTSASDASIAHANLTWDGSPGRCLSCHTDEAEDMYASTHYQWQGEALYMTHGPQKQGKIAGAVNSYCINI